LKNDWWRGTLCLYAQNCEFYSLIDEFTLKYHNIQPALITLRAMASYRPKKEQSNLLFLIEKYERSDDSYYIDSDMGNDDWRGF
jgi:hypothetical protein